MGASTSFPPRTTSPSMTPLNLNKHNGDDAMAAVASEKSLRRPRGRPPSSAVSASSAGPTDLSVSTTPPPSSSSSLLRPPDTPSSSSSRPPHPTGKSKRRVRSSSPSSFGGGHGRRGRLRSPEDANGEDRGTKQFSEMSVRGLDLLRYAAIASDGTYRCLECDRVQITKHFKNKYSFQRHAFLYHEGVERKVFPCVICQKEFSRPDKMKSHLKTAHDCVMPKSAAAAAAAAAAADPATAAAMAAAGMDPAMLFNPLLGLDPTGSDGKATGRKMSGRGRNANAAAGGASTSSSSSGTAMPGSGSASEAAAAATSVAATLMSHPFLQHAVAAEAAAAQAAVVAAAAHAAADNGSKKQKRKTT